MIKVGTLKERIVSGSRVDPITGCWMWLGAKDACGYGLLQYQRRCRRAHRLSFEVFNGPIDECVLHRCDTPACVNPDHLFLGTRADNNADRTSKGRTSHGNKHWFAVLSELDVIAIRKRQGTPPGHIAADYGVARSTIRAVLSRHTWKHVP